MARQKKVFVVAQAPGEGCQDAAAYHCVVVEFGCVEVGIDFVGMVVESQLHMEAAPVGMLAGRSGIVEEVRSEIVVARSETEVPRLGMAEAHWRIEEVRFGTAEALVEIEAAQVETEEGHSEMDHLVAEIAEVVQNPDYSGIEVAQED